MGSAKIAIIGAGAMGSAVAKGLICCSDKEEINPENKPFSLNPDQIILFDLDPNKLNHLKMEFSVKIADSYAKIFKENPIEQVIIAVKPKDINSLLIELKQAGLEDKTNCLITSIAAGIEIASFEKVFPNHAVIRVMPNTPCQIQKGISVLALNKKVNEAQKNFAVQVFEALGEVLILDESNLNAVTALSGSGPAYVFYLIEAMTDAGIKLGLSYEAASMLARQTAYGAANLVIESGIEANKLREQVTSPGGTTQAALDSFAKNKFKDIIIEAIEAASERAKALSNQ